MSRLAEAMRPDLFSMAAVEDVVMSMPDGVPVDVCVMFEKLALEIAAKGFTFYSARDITARMRWHHQIDRGDREFVINNNWSPALARWFMVRHPEFPAFFETRESAND